ncbi:MAG: ribonuclease III [Acidobacteria bacterium]|nr:ribonuclease III [Acidobacteriota bacterium]TDI53288.1 MAG: ribonuclease III [Acidobacteriota bacterium]
MTLEDKLGYTFENPGLLRLALTHRSVSSDDPSRNDNERLEFLGDAVLQLVITDLLYESYPHLAEGQMAKVRAAVVSGSALAEIARSIDLGAHIELAQGEERTGGREKDSILADAVEAILGSVYLDSGIDSVGEIILSLWADRVADRAKSPGIKDYKTRLQEHVARDGRRPVYEVEGSGPDHSRQFRAVVYVDGSRLGSGEGRSKKAAEQSAAQEALASLSSDSG